MNERPPRVLSPFHLKWMLNLYPPLLFNRVRIVDVSADFRFCRVRVSRSWLTRNLHGTTFGGTIFAAGDPIYALLLWQVFAHRGERVQVWLRSARVRYRKPAASALTLEFHLSQDEVDEAAAALDRDGRFSKSYGVEARDRDGDVCAAIETEVFIRHPWRGQKEVSAF